MHCGGFVRAGLGAFVIVAAATLSADVAGFPGNPIRNLTIRNLTMTMADDPACDFSANGGWVPPKTDAFRVPKSYTVGKAQGWTSV